MGEIPFGVFESDLGLNEFGVGCGRGRQGNPVGNRVGLDANRVGNPVRTGFGNRVGPPPLVQDFEVFEVVEPRLPTVGFLLGRDLAGLSGLPECGPGDLEQVERFGLCDLAGPRRSVGKEENHENEQEARG